MLYLERRRAERAQNRFVLILVDVQTIVNGVSGKDRMVQMLAKSLSEATRETDIIGWYLDNSLMAVIGTELEKQQRSCPKRFLEKASEHIRIDAGKREECDHLRSFHFFPEEYGSGANDHSANIKPLPGNSKARGRKKSSVGD